MSFRKVTLIVIILLLTVVSIGFGQTAEDADRLLYEGISLYEQYRFEEANDKFLAAAKINEKLGPIRREYVSYCYNLIAYCYYRLGQYDKAIEYYELTLVIYKDLGLIDFVATVLGNIGIVYDAWGQYDKAIEYYEQSLAINEELEKKDQIATVLNSIGSVYGSWGQYDKAIEYYEQALAIAEELGLQDSIALDLNDIGLVYYFWGQYDKAIEYYEQAMTIIEELGIKEEIATVLNNIGAVYGSWGQYDKAIEHYEQALAVVEELGLKDQIATYLNNIGVAYNYLEQYDKAIEYYDQSLAIAEELGLKDKIAGLFGNIGLAYDYLEQYDKAMEYYEQSLAIAEELGLQDSIALDLNNIGKVYYFWGQYDKAIEYFEQSLAIAEELGLKDKIALLFGNIGLVYYMQENYKQTVEYFNNSILIIENLRLTAPGAIRRDYLASQIFTYQGLISTYIRDNEPELAFNTIELSSSKYLAEQMLERINEEILSFEGIGSYRSKIDNNSVVINYANTDRDDSAIIIAANDNIYATEVNKQTFISGINEQYERTISRTVEDLRGLEVIEREENIEEIRLIDETNKQEFNNIINYYRYLLSKPGPSPAEAGALEQIARKLYNLLIAPIEEQLEGKTELIIIPDGILGFLPFETLIMPDGRYLIEKYHIKYTQSLTVSELIANRDYSDNRSPMLAFGGAVYDEVTYETDMIESSGQLEYLEQQILVALNDGESTRSAYDELGLSNWNNLPGTLTEVTAIMSIISQTIVYTGADVSEYNVKQLSDNGTLRNYKVLHFATHGLVVPEIPELSAVVLSLFEDEQNNEDGYLTMKEIAMLDINADFVNLSACETGLGKIYGGEGVVGLTQSFLIAGANGLSVSLWQVADESTMQFMIGMYKLVEEENYSYDEAITEMKRRFISRTNDNGQDYSEPFYWAPFVYYGE